MNGIGSYGKIPVGGLVISLMVMAGVASVVAYTIVKGVGEVQECLDTGEATVTLGVVR